MTKKKHDEVEHLIRQAQSPVTPSDLELRDAEIRKLKSQLDISKKEAADYRKQLSALTRLGDPVITKIRPEPKRERKETAGTVVLLASDWHVEEIVRPEQVSGLNKYEPEIAKKRAEKFFQGALRCIEVIDSGLNIGTIVLALLGDFITNDLHDDSAENCAMRPTEAALYAQDLIASGIRFLLEHTKKDIVCVCHSGNHGRTTRRIHYANEKGHSLEHMMYVSLAQAFSSEPRITFRVSGGYHSFIDILGMKTRFHHGHAIMYHGGVGGITIPVNKAIAQWNMAVEADLDVFGHFHQFLDGGHWQANGSLIGYAAYAVSIKAKYEEPRQTFMVIDEKRGRTWTAPIYVGQ